MADAYEVYDWDSEIEEDGGEFRLLEPGFYPFEVVGVKKEYYDGHGGGSAPACPKAAVTMRVGNPPETTLITDGFLLYSGMQWKISAFFRAIGYKQHGQKVAMNWDEDFLKGKKGLCEVDNVPGFKDKDKLFNNVKGYSDPVQGQTAPNGGSEEW